MCYSSLLVFFFSNPIVTQNIELSIEEDMTKENHKGLNHVHES